MLRRYSDISASLLRDSAGFYESTGSSKDIISRMLRRFFDIRSFGLCVQDFILQKFALDVWH